MPSLALFPPSLSEPCATVSAHTALRQQPCASSAFAHHVASPGRKLIRTASLRFPTLPGGTSLPRLLPVLRRHLPRGRKAIPRFVKHIRPSSDVGHPLIFLFDLIGHRPRRGCSGRNPLPLPIVAPDLDVLPVGDKSPRSQIGFQTMQSYPYRTSLAAPRPLTSSADHRCNGRLLSPLSFPIR